MQSAVVIAFYIWLALSVAILLARVARRFARRSRPSSSHAQTADAAANERIIDISDGATQPHVSAPARADAVAVGRGARDGGVATRPDPRPRPAAAEPPRDEAPSPRSAPVESSAPVPSLDIDRPTTPDDHRTAPVPTPTLAQLLSGVVVPHQLVPVVPAGTDPTRQASSLMASGVDPHVVGGALADELERLGYELMPLGETELLAQRGDDVISLAFDTSPEQPNEIGHHRFPDAKPGDVVIDLWVGGGPRPN